MPINYIPSECISLDLRWNNVGLIGGRAILSLCQSNSTLNDFQLVGNNIPEDIMQSIGLYISFSSNGSLDLQYKIPDNALKKNDGQRQMHFGHSQNMAVLSRQLQTVHAEKDQQISTTLTRMSLQEQAMLKANR